VKLFNFFLKANAKHTKLQFDNEQKLIQTFTFITSKFSSKIFKQQSIFLIDFLFLKNKQINKIFLFFTETGNYEL
jgi:hypothetical protein